MGDFVGHYHALEERVLAALREDLEEAEFETVAFDAFWFQCLWNQPYARFCATRPDPQCWQEIPAVPPIAFKRASLSCAPAELVEKTFWTSGTTGDVRGAHHLFNLRLYETAVLRGWERLRLPEAVPIVLAPSAKQAPASSLSHMLSTLVRERGAEENFWMIEADGSLDPGRFLAAARVCFAMGKPLALLGTALAFLQLFERLEGQVCPPLQSGSFVMETGGYKGSGRELAKDDLYGMFAERLGVASDQVINEYGMTELSSQFYTWGLGRPHEGPPWVRAVVIDPETGREAEVDQSGLLRIFDLANLNSVLAIDTQDLAIRRAHGFELLGRDPGALPRGCSRAADESLGR
jgi:hypothetical protein